MVFVYSKVYFIVKFGNNVSKMRLSLYNEQDKLYTTLKTCTVLLEGEGALGLI